MYVIYIRKSTQKHQSKNKSQNSMLFFQHIYKKHPDADNALWIKGPFLKNNLKAYSDIKIFLLNSVSTKTLVRFLIGVIKIILSFLLL